MVFSPKSALSQLNEEKELLKKLSTMKTTTNESERPKSQINFYKGTFISNTMKAFLANDNIFKNGYMTLPNETLEPPLPEQLRVTQTDTFEKPCAPFEVRPDPDL
jgi:hypothetical protein